MSLPHTNAQPTLKVPTKIQAQLQKRRWSQLTCCSCSPTLFAN